MMRSDDDAGQRARDRGQARQTQVGDGLEHRGLEARTLVAREPDRARLEACDPVRLALGLASIVALLVSIRFAWLAFFPLLFLLQLKEPGGRQPSQRPMGSLLVVLVKPPLRGFPRLAHRLDVVAQPPRTHHTLRC